ncbi:MAG: proline--tRNA ligase [Dehalococcoidia bacterium]|nr:proline--tRNA ligase [Dehalococcoidia bacterium]MDW8119034.1 proline--tRNA ligase [Chloroflexota bacterium]
MRMSQLFARTLRTDPADAETPSHRLLVKAGMIYPFAAGVYAYMPLALRSLQKIEAIIREEMNGAGAQEVRLPALQPLDLWQETGRADAFGPILFRLKDRREREMVLAPTHEEVITLLVRAFVRSYRDLPLNLYQIQTKFRDEPRPRGGLIRVREFEMKDAYSFDADEDGLNTSYQAMVRAYRNIFDRCGVPAIMVEADSGAIGGKDSHEFILPTPIGEDTIILCGACGYAANAERAQSRKPPVPVAEALPLQEVHTPNIKTIDALAAYLGIPTHQTLKAVFYHADGRIVFVVIRGDLQVNEVKLKRVLQATDLRLASDAEVAQAGLVAGSASPIGLKGIPIVADDSILSGSNFVVGANRPHYHLRNANYPRDFHADTIADIALAETGHGCIKCGAPLRTERGVEVGHVFKLGTFFSQRLGAFYLDREGQQRPIVMGCYGIGVGRLLAAVIEHNHDSVGMRFPPSVAPFQVYLVGLNLEDSQVAQQAEHLYHALREAGMEVLYDDRAESAGVKLHDADLLGFPVRVVVSPRTLRQKSAEVKERSKGEATMVGLEQVVDTVQKLVHGSLTAKT